MLKKLIITSLLTFLSPIAMSAIIEVPHPEGNVIVKETEDGEQKLYYDSQELVSSTYISVNRIIPTPEGVLDAYLVELSSGGSGTMPTYTFLTVKANKPAALSKEFGAGAIKSLVNDGKTVNVKFEPLLNNLDGSVVEPAQTVVYKNGVVTVK